MSHTKQLCFSFLLFIFPRRFLLRRVRELAKAWVNYSSSRLAPTFHADRSLAAISSTQRRALRSCASLFSANILKGQWNLDGLFLHGFCVAQCRFLSVYGPTWFNAVSTKFSFLNASLRNFIRLIDSEFIARFILLQWAYAVLWRCVRSAQGRSGLSGEKEISMLFVHIFPCYSRPTKKVHGFSPSFTVFSDFRTVFSDFRCEKRGILSGYFRLRRRREHALR